ncbi:MAG TPA: lamin tail domain-containing protein, partial [Phototrophicaceae bacterium]|nr:lamin tail domain-containing protein [Phototrophicaceae bacterium]
MSRIHFRFISILGPLIGLIVLLAANGHQTQAAASDLFFSEYLEGITSTINNHALEIYNGTGATVNLSGYSLELYPNGVTFPSVTLNLSGTLVSGDVYVIAHPQADTPVLAVADLLDAGINGFDGNDAIALVKSGTGKIDVIGKIGENPGTEWGSGLTSTADNTLVRKPAICAGDSNGSDPFDPSIQWIGFPQDTMTDIGKHTSDCVPANTATSTPTSTLTKTSTFTATPTKSPTPTSTGTVPTSTSTPTSTATFTSTATSTPSSTSGGSTATPTSTAT